MAAPLSQQLRPAVFEPKITQLYLHLFNVLANEEAGDAVPAEGFWRELFLLRADKQQLYDILKPMTAIDLVHMQVRSALTLTRTSFSSLTTKQAQTQSFFKRAITEAASGTFPRTENALEVRSPFASPWPIILTNSESHGFLVRGIQ